MIRKDLLFSDGTRIFYEEKNGRVQRYIEYSFTPQEKEKIKKDPTFKTIYGSMRRKYNAGKYYYLNVLYCMACRFNETQKRQLFNEIKELHDKVEKEYDPKLLNEDFLKTYGKYWKNNDIQCAAFFSTIYLAMLDLEEDKERFPNSLGKTMVLRSCEEVVLNNKDPKAAAVMFERKQEYVPDDYFTPEYNSRYEKYNGYNDYDDDTIDIGFDGFPKATWNVD